MGGASSASAVPAASAAGGYASPASMARATIGGTTGSNVAGMGYVPRAQTGQGGVNYAKMADVFGGALSDSFGKIGSSIAGQQYGLGGTASSDAFTPMTSSPFAGLAGAMPQVRSAPFRMAASNAGPLRQTGMGYSI
jgi:hypothetical protein